MASGDLLLELCDPTQYSKLFNLVALGKVPASISTPHRSLNTVRGVRSDEDLLELTEAELFEGWKEEYVINVQRIKIRREKKEILTKHLILTFAMNNQPEFIQTGYIQICVRPYVPSTRRCYKCQRFGHGSQSCRGRLTCAKCAANDHAADSCQDELHCANCNGGHPAYSGSWPKWKLEKEIIFLKKKTTYRSKKHVSVALFLKADLMPMRRLRGLHRYSQRRLLITRPVNRQSRH